MNDTMYVRLDRVGFTVVKSYRAFYRMILPRTERVSNSMWLHMLRQSAEVEREMGLRIGLRRVISEEHDYDQHGY